MGITPITLRTDDELSRAILTLLLSKSDDMLIVPRAEAPEDAIHVIAMCSEADALEYLETLRGDSISSVLLLQRVSARVLERVSDTGIRAILLRSEVDHTLPDTIREVAAGAFVLSPTVAELALSASFSPTMGTARIMGSASTMGLKPAVYETLFLFCVLGFSKREVARALNLSENTVSSRIRLGYESLGVNNQHDAFMVLTRSRRDAVTLER